MKPRFSRKGQNLRVKIQDETEKSSRMNACSSKFPTCLRSLSEEHPTSTEISLSLVNSTVYNIASKRYKKEQKILPQSSLLILILIYIFIFSFILSSFSFLLNLTTRHSLRL